MSRRISYLLIVCLFAQLSTGCHLFQRIAWRIRSCHGCYPHFNHPGYGGPVMDGPAFAGSPYGDCSSCSSGYGAAPVVYSGASPAVQMPAPPSVGIPMPANPATDKK